jgi:hypothetical protein
MKNELISNIACDDTNEKMINLICRYAYVTRAYNQNYLHAGIKLYLPELDAENFYQNMCRGTNQILPITVFLMTMYNACFMFQINKTENMLMGTMEQFDLIPNLDNVTCLDL